MGLTFTLGKLLIITALVLQGLYIAGYLPNQSMLKAVEAGWTKTGQSLRISSHPLHKTVAQNLALICQAIGGMIALAALNLFANSRAILKLNILGEVLLTFLIGVPWNWIESKGSLFDPNDRNVFHLVTNWSIIGGLWYWHSCIRSGKQ